MAEVSYNGSPLYDETPSSVQGEVTTSPIRYDVRRVFLPRMLLTRKGCVTLARANEERDGNRMVELIRMDRDVRASHMHARLMCADDVCIYFSSGLCFSCCCRKNRVSRPSVNVVIEMDVSTICFKLLTVS